MIISLKTNININYFHDSYKMINYCHFWDLKIKILKKLCTCMQRQSRRLKNVPHPVTVKRTCIICVKYVLKFNQTIARTC